jgi:putative SOS response-associated peptidase YedK
MCNDYRLEVDIASIVEDFDDLKIKIKMPEGASNVPAREDIKMTDVGPIVWSVGGERAAGELVNRRWGWPEQIRISRGDNAALALDAHLISPSPILRS